MFILFLKFFQKYFSTVQQIEIPDVIRLCMQDTIILLANEGWR